MKSKGMAGTCLKREGTKCPLPQEQRQGRPVDKLDKMSNFLKRQKHGGQTPIKGVIKMITPSKKGIGKNYFSL